MEGSRPGKLITRVIFCVESEAQITNQEIKHFESTAGFLIHGRRAQVFGQIFGIRPEAEPGFLALDRRRSQNFGIRPEAEPGFLALDRRRSQYSTTGTEKYSFTVLPGRRKIRFFFLLFFSGFFGKFYLENPLQKSATCVPLPINLFGPVAFQ